MSKQRTEEQKLRRKYIAECQKKGIKPMLVENWKKKFAKKAEVKKSEKPVKKAEKTIKKTGKAPKIVMCQQKVHEVRLFDIIKFVDFPACSKLNFGLRIACQAWEEMKNGKSVKLPSKTKKPVKK